MRIILNTLAILQMWHWHWEDFTCWLVAVPFEVIMRVISSSGITMQPKIHEYANFNELIITKGLGILGSIPWIPQPCVQVIPILISEQINTVNVSSINHQMMFTRTSSSCFYSLVFCTEWLVYENRKNRPGNETIITIPVWIVQKQPSSNIKSK